MNIKHPPAIKKNPLVVQACRGQKTERTPVWFMRQAGRYMEEYRKVRKKWTIKEIAKTPELAAQVTIDPVGKLGVDAAILFSDILLLAEPMGFKLEYTEGEGPAFHNPIREPDDIRRIPEIDAAQEMKFTADAVRLIRKNLPPEKALIGFAGAPFTLASYLIEGGHSDNYLKTKNLMRQDRTLWTMLMEKLSRAVTDLCLIQVQAGADIIQIFDSWAGCLAPGDYEEFVLPHVRKIVAALQAQSVPVIYFSTGTGGCIELLKKTQADVISVDWRVSLGEAWRRLDYETAVQGNLDPAALFGPHEYIERRVRTILDEADERPGHIFNLGHGILQHTPVDNVKLVVDLVHKISFKER
ncbi:MAG: uroporphyrinogen decarboxylase [Elusimicrobia bacterium]|nr:uroporphyrinogen decarboxylase [Elusimicrobiota bacterium]